MRLPRFEEKGLTPGEDAYTRELKTIAVWLLFVVLIAVLAGALSR